MHIRKLSRDRCLPFVYPFERVTEDGELGFDGCRNSLPPSLQCGFISLPGQTPVYDLGNDDPSKPDHPDDTSLESFGELQPVPRQSLP